MITNFKIYEYRSEYPGNLTDKYHIDYSETFKDNILFIKEDSLITDDWKKAVIDAITSLPIEYKEKVYSSRLVWDKDVDFQEPNENRKAGDKILSHVGISNVGMYWEHSDLPFLHEHFEKYNLIIKYVHEYHYITIQSGEGLIKYYHNIADKYNL